MRRSRWLAIAVLVLAGSLGSLLTASAAQPIASDAFQRTWARTDQPVASGAVSRTWMWGPQPNSAPLTESYVEAPGGKRTVQYFDKTRMEDNSYRAASPWDVTNGLLAEELITGRMQVGDNAFQQLAPAQVNVAGDQSDPNGPTYASFTGLMAAGAVPDGTTVTQTVNRAGQVVSDASLASYGVSARDVGAATHHDVASVFWEFMNSSGLVSVNGQTVTDHLFVNAFYATGYPLTEAYWTHVLVGGVQKQVLVQVFERRVLTFTPDNPAGWQVEAGNVGLHYYTWRYNPGAVQHVFLIVMENKEYTQIIGNADAPYINQLASQYALADDYYAVTHPSLPNYLALFGGDTFGVSTDCTDCFVDQPNLADSLDAAGKTWKSYQEDLPSPCFLGAQSGEYVMRHDPFLYFHDIRDNPTRCQQVVPLTQLGADIAASQVPNFAWITPNLIDDMHDGTVAQGDAWLASFVPTILASSAWKDGGLLMIVWDEGSSSAGCCGVSGGRVPLLVISPRGPSAYHSPVPATHYDLLRAVEDLWGLHRVGLTDGPGVQGLPDIVR